MGMAAPSALPPGIAEADALVRSGKSVEAEARYRRLLEAHPGDLLLLLRLAQLLEQLPGRAGDATGA